MLCARALTRPQMSEPDRADTGKINGTLMAAQRLYPHIAAGRTGTADVPPVLRASPVRISSSDQANANGELEVGPDTVGSEYFGRFAAHGQRKTAAITQ